MKRRDFLTASAATAFGAGPIARALTPPEAPVAYDPISLILHGRREILISGEMHYSRSTRAMWPQLLDRSRTLGLNAIAAYVFWGVHEPQRGVFDFAGENDLGYFLSLCKAKGLSVFLRAGPYCCAEWNYGGFPSWLRDEPNIVTRTMNDAYCKRVELYFEQLAKVIKPHLAVNGGAVILVQVENEYANISKRYGEAGQEYLRWMVELGKRVGFSAVPTTTCEGGAAGAIETVNGNTIDQHRVDEVRTTHPTAPVLWSEFYPAWYQIWGGPHPPQRSPQDMATSFLSFLGEGGSGVNYYMWHGGTNFGRTSMYLQMTSYDFSAPLDEYGRPSALGLYLAALHKVITQNRTTLLEGKRERTVDTSGAVSVTWTRGPEILQLIANPGTKPATFEGRTLPPHSSRLTSGKSILFDTEEQLARTMPVETAWRPIATPAGWTCWNEPLPNSRKDRPITAAEPTEQLLLTRDRTDYCWYSTTFNASTSPTSLVIPYGGDFFYVFVDGKMEGQSQKPFWENRGPIVPPGSGPPFVVANHHDNEHTDGYRHQFDLGTLAAGSHRLDILACALGMIKGDWQIGYSMEMERKGIWRGVEINGQPQHDWQMRPYLTGESLNLASAPTASWQALTGPAPLTWYRGTFALEPGSLASDADFRIDAQGLGKGSLYLNGHGVGRFWNIQAEGSGQPSQRYYHVPRTWLQPHNTLILFEEQSGSPEQVRLERRLARPK
jgi:hypothetical protein